MRIGLLWHSLASGNMGVRALTVSNMALIEQAARDCGVPVRFVMIGMGERGGVADPAPDLPYFAVSSRSLLAPSGYWRLLGELDAVVDISAGDSFADIYGPKRFGFMWLTKALAIRRGKPLLLAPQTIGPFEKPGYRALAAWVMTRSAAVVARDRRSLDVVRRLAPRARAAVSVDVAFGLPFEDRARERGGARTRVGVNVSGLLFHEAESGRNRFGLSYDYARYTRALLAALAARPDLDVFLVPHATSTSDPGDDDGQIADRLAGEFPSLTRVPDFADASAAKSFISGLDFLFAARMHACIAAFSSGTPVLPVAYSRKFAGLFDMVDYGHILPMTGIDEAQAVERSLAALAAAPELAAEIERGSETVQALLDVYRGQLRALLSGTA